MSENTNDDRSPIARVLGLEKSEYYAVAWSFVYFFCVLSAYYILRSVRETMAVEGGVRNIPWLFSSTFVIMLIVAPVFGWIASRFARRRFLPWVYYFFVANILLFFLAFGYAVHYDYDFVWIGRAFFVWLSVFNLFVVSVFWSFMADIYTREQGQRLFGVISAGGSLGALLGPLTTSFLVVPIGFQNLLPASAALLLFAVYCIHRLRHWAETHRHSDDGKLIVTGKPLGGNAFAGISHVLRSKYFIAIAVAMVIANLLGAALYMFMADLVGKAIEDTDQRTRIFALVDGISNIGSLIGQLLVLKHVVRRLGIGVTLTLYPLASIIGFALLAMNPSFIAVAVLQAVRRAIGFGIHKPATDMLYTVVTPEEKYKTKNFIETAIYRAGDLLSSWSIRFLFGLGITSISLLLLPFAILWAGLSLWIGRDYRRRDQTPLGEPARE